jgi:hypothetical protein
MLGLILLVILVLLLVGTLPHWPYTTSYGYGYWPSGIFLVIIVILVILIFAGRVPFYW